MHMADALLSPAVGLSMSAVSAGAIGYSIAKIKKEELSERKLPLMAVCAAFVFAAQMINFTIPATGSSGHIGGGILLAALLGSYPALLTLSSVLIIQCLFFADGGLLALGCNIFNMGVIPCLIIYPLLFQPFLKKRIGQKQITIASILSVVLGLQFGAFAVVLETVASGITELPFLTFLALMQPIHAAIGFVEGIVTAGILCFIHENRPEILESAHTRSDVRKTVSIKKILAALTITTLITGGGVSLLASSHPDGLEWAIEKTANAPIEQQGTVFDTTAAIQEKTAFMPDYDFPAENKAIPLSGTTVAGIIGALLTFVLAVTSGWVISKTKQQ